MRNYSNPKLKLLYLKQFFEEQTDKTHQASMPDILAYLETNGIHAERKGIYTDLDYLEEFGMRLRDDSKDRNKSYYLQNSNFEASEIKLIIDSVASSKYLSEKKSMELMGKLEKLVSVHQRHDLKREVKVIGRVKNMNDKILDHVNTINKAIGANKTIKFRYFHFNVEKQREFSRNGVFFEVSPWVLIYDNNTYYLLGYHNENIRTYRVDRMINVSQGVNERQGKEQFEAFDLVSFTKATFGMYSGKEEKVEMAFHNSLVDTVIDKFGKEVMMFPVDDTHFKITVPVSVSPQFFGWIFGLGGKVTILGPQSVVKQMKDMLEKVSERY